MSLRAPTPAPRIELNDVYGVPFVLGQATGRRQLLCFFRDPACPFCNFRLYQLTAQAAAFTRLGLDVVAIFLAQPAAVKRFAARKPRPFPVLADPESRAYDAYDIKSSAWGKYKGILTRIPTVLKGLKIVGLAGLKTGNLMPADFLLDEEARIAETWYGRDAGDRIPLERVELFAARGLIRHAKASQRDVA